MVFSAYSLIEDRFMATKRLSDKNTKAEILTAYEDLIREKKALETELQQASNPQVKAPIVQAATPQSVIQLPPSRQTMESLIDGLSRLHLSSGAAIGGLSEQLIAEVIKLQEVQRSLQDEQSQLMALYELEPTDDSLYQLIEQYGTDYKTCQEELNGRKETLEQEFEAAKKAWAKEQEDYRRQLKQRNEELSKLHQRDETEYVYGLTIARQQAHDEFDQVKARRLQELADQKEVLQKAWQDRETAIALSEKEDLDLRTKADGLKAELEAATKRAKEEGKGIAHHQAKVRADMVAKDVEGQKRTYELRLQALLDTMQTQESRINTLSRQLDAVLKQTQDLAVKAIEGASNVGSFQAMKDVVLEQAKSQGKAK
jgi:chromosome segregation ATPase